MKYKDLVKALTKSGWVITHGGSHDIAKHSQRPGVRIPIPRHREINELTARGILEDAGLH